ncbi:sphingosine kinase [Plasmodiophora brassicae]
MAIGAVAVVAIAYWARVAAPGRSRSEAALRKQLTDHTNICLWTRLRVLVLLNPLGGGGRAKRVWESVVKGTLHRAAIEFDLVETARAGHARDLMSSLANLLEYAGLVVISGDGMLHEIVNGLFDRCSGNEGRMRMMCDTLPILMIPAGTMNGLSSSLGNPTPADALLHLLQCESARSVDAYAVRSRATNVTRLDVHCVSAGIVADHDELLERRLRSLPQWARVALAPAIVIGLNRSYAGRLYLRPAPSQEGVGLKDAFALDADDQGRPDWRMIDDRFVLLSVFNTHRASHDMIFAPAALPDDGAVYVVVVRAGISRITMVRLFLAFETGRHIEFDEIEIYRVTAAEYRPREPGGVMNVSGETLPSGDTDITVVPGLLKFVF